MRLTQGSYSNLSAQYSHACISCMHNYIAIPIDTHACIGLYHV